MDETEALKTLSAVAQTIRLKVVVILAHAGEAGLPSSGIADQVGVPRNLMSSHLAVLTGAGVVASRRDGRTVTYTLRTGTIGELARYLDGLSEAMARPA